MPFTFTPPTGYRDTTAFPTKPANETAFRDSMQDLLDQIKDYVNSTDIFNSTNSPLAPNYHKFASGFIMQWGYVTLASGGFCTLGTTYPVTFIGAWVIRDNSTPAIYSITDYSTSGFKVWNSVGMTTFFYLSIGK